MKIILIIFFIMINISNVLAVENDCSGLNKLSQDYANCIAKKIKKKGSETSEKIKEKGSETSSKIKKSGSKVKSKAKKTLKKINKFLKNE